MAIIIKKCGVDGNEIEKNVPTPAQLSNFVACSLTNLKDFYQQNWKITFISLKSMEFYIITSNLGKQAIAIRTKEEKYEEHGCCTLTG
jgi:hypothetical protein